MLRLRESPRARQGERRPPRRASAGRVVDLGAADVLVEVRDVTCDPAPYTPRRWGPRPGRPHRRDRRRPCPDGSPRGELASPPRSEHRAGAGDGLTAIADRHRLTRAEAAVLGCIAEGLSNREIAGRLFVSIETVKTHVQRILAKLEVSSRLQAAALVNRGSRP